MTSNRDQKIEERIEEWLKDTTQILNISSLKLKEWPKQLVGKEHLITTLYYYGNNITSLPDGMINLIILNCSFSKLTTLPNDMIKLQKLNCSWNKLTTIPNNMTELLELNCFSNKLTSLPSGMIKLRMLNFSFNKLTSLNSGMTKLQRINFSFNNLTSLPNGMIKLQSLNCYNNDLITLPDDMINLIELECYDNKLFSDDLSDWKKLWIIKRIYRKQLLTSGIKRIVKLLNNRLYLPRLNRLFEELIWSPNHPGKFFTSLPKAGKW